MKLASLCFAIGLAGIGARLFGGDRTAGASEHTSHHSAGAPEEWAEYLGDRRHGACRRWYPDGKLRAEGRYELGRAVGRWTWYAPDGSADRAKSGLYADGKRVSD